MGKIGKVGIGLLLGLGLPLWAYHHSYHHSEPEEGYHHSERYHHYRGTYRENSGSGNLSPEEICDRYYECLDHCPTVMYVKCQQKCHKKYPCDDF